jgi:hypothetical protein
VNDDVKITMYRIKREDERDREERKKENTARSSTNASDVNARHTMN